MEILILFLPLIASIISGFFGKYILYNKIDKIFFISKWTDKKNIALGYNVIVMSVDALHLFWQDWHHLLMKNEVFEYTFFDNAA